MGSFTGTVPSILAGDAPSGDDWDSVLDELTALNVAWTSEAPTWTAGAGTPSVGDGALTGRYRQVGKTKDFQFRLTVGGTTTFGTAGQRWEFTIPGGGVAAEVFMGSAFFFDSSAAANYTLIWKIDNGASTMRFWRNDAAPSVEFLNNAPVTPATSDRFMASGTIEIV